MGHGSGLSCATLEGKLEGRDVFLEALNLFPFPDSPVFFISEHFLKLSPSLLLPTGFSMMKTEGGGSDSEEPVPRAQCPVPAQSSQYPQF